METAKPLRWKPALFIIALAAIAYAIILLKSEWKYEQVRSMGLIITGLVTYLLLLIWWLAFSRATGRARLAGIAVFILPLLLFRLKGLTGDFIPIFEFRFAKRAAAIGPAGKTDSTAKRTDFPQLLGPNRDAVIPGIELGGAASYIEVATQSEINLFI